MRRIRAFGRGRVVWILLAGGLGYLLGGWHVATLRSGDLSASQSVALRFPEEDTAAVKSDEAVEVSATAATPTSAMMAANVQLALLSPEPMRGGTLGGTVPQMEPQAAPQAAVPAQAEPSPRPVAVALPPRPNKAIAPRPAPMTTAAIASAHRHAERQGFMLNDAQIASIKHRLHLTPDQERMWPGVEAALRNIAYERARDARRRGGPAGGMDVASVDPNGSAVQGLKSAAFPLIMSFSTEQRNEVRSLAHVMGLDQLASEF